MRNVEVEAAAEGVARFVERNHQSVSVLVGGRVLILIFDCTVGADILFLDIAARAAARGVADIGYDVVHYEDYRAARFNALFAVCNKAQVARHCRSFVLVALVGVVSRQAALAGEEVCLVVRVVGIAASAVIAESAVFDSHIEVVEVERDFRDAPRPSSAHSQCRVRILEGRYDVARRDDSLPVAFGVGGVVVRIAARAVRYLRGNDVAAEVRAVCVVSYGIARRDNHPGGNRVGRLAVTGCAVADGEDPLIVEVRFCGLHER